MILGEFGPIFSDTLFTQTVHNRTKFEVVLLCRKERILPRTPNVVFMRFCEKTHTSGNQQPRSRVGKGQTLFAQQVTISFLRCLARLLLLEARLFAFRLSIDVS